MDRESAIRRQPLTGLFIASSSHSEITQTCCRLVRQARGHAVALTIPFSEDRSDPGDGRVLSPELRACMVEYSTSRQLPMRVPPRGESFRATARHAPVEIGSNSEVVRVWPEWKKKRPVGSLEATRTLSGGKKRQSEAEVRRFMAAEGRDSGRRPRAETRAEGYAGAAVRLLWQH